MNQASQTLIVGVGDGGICTLNRIMREGLNSLAYLAINTHRQRNPDFGTRLLVIGSGNGGAMGAVHGREVAKASAGEIFDAISHAKTVILTGGLGGGTASGALPVIATIAQESGAQVSVFVSTPFIFEGSIRREVAQKMLHKLREQVPHVSVMPCDRLLPLSSEPSLPAIPQIYELVNRALMWHILASLTG